MWQVHVILTPDAASKSTRRQRSGAHRSTGWIERRVLVGLKISRLIKMCTSEKQCGHRSVHTCNHTHIHNAPEHTMKRSLRPIS